LSIHELLVAAAAVFFFINFPLSIHARIALVFLVINSCIRPPLPGVSKHILIMNAGKGHVKR
jgi:hypothetical protein